VTTTNPLTHRTSIALRVAAGTLALGACSSATTTPPATTTTAVREPSAGVDGNPFRIGRALVIPHAGGDGMYPEDTLYAYEHSIALGGDVVDIDVWVAKDGVPVAIHDATVDRTTNGSGDVATLTSSQLAALDAGYHFERDGAYPYRGKGIGVPTVEAILRRFPETLVTIDMKDTRASSAQPVCDLLTRLDRTDDVYVGSDTDQQVAAFRTVCPGLHTSGTSEERRVARAAREAGDTTFRSRQLVGQPGYLADDGTPRVTAATLEFAHRSNTAILTWVVDDPVAIAGLIDIGIDGIYTRRPDVMIDIMRSRGLLPPDTTP
jgi:glycerophosphoryl diester phosphodiesterase